MIKTRKTAFKKLAACLCILMVTGLIAPMLSMTGSADETATGEVVRTFYDDAVQNAWQQGFTDDEAKDYLSIATDSAPNVHGGEKSYRIKLKSATARGKMLYMNWVDNSSFDMTAYDADNTYLELYFMPMALRERAEVGFTCGDNPYASIRVDISNYVTITKDDINQWKYIKIPLSDFMSGDKAIFDANGSGRTEFEWNRCKGFSIAGSDEDIAEQIHWCRIDDVVLVKYSGSSTDPTEPTEPTDPPEPTDTPETKNEVTDVPIDFYYRCINDNTPVVGSPDTAATYMAVGGAGKTVPNNHYAPFKITLPQGITKTSVVKSARLNLYAVDKGLPFAMFYMPNETWTVSSGKDAMYNDSKTISRAFHRWTSETYADIYPTYVKENAANGDYETEDAAKTMLESAANGIFKDNYLGVFGTAAEYTDKRNLSIDITAAVNRAIKEGKSSVNLVFSAPGTTRSQFMGVTSKVDAAQKARYSMSWENASAEESFSVSAVTFTDGDGSEISALPSGGGSVRAKITAANTYATEKKLLAILVSYDTVDGTPHKENAVLSTVTIPAGGGTVSTDVLNAGDGTVVRVFLWDIDGNMIPTDGISSSRL